jgi:hypothetical protein
MRWQCQKFGIKPVWQGNGIPFSIKMPRHRLLPILGECQNQQKLTVRQDVKALRQIEHLMIAKKAGYGSRS